MPRGDRPDMRGQKVLVTGGFGFIGSNLAHHLGGGGAEVTILDNLDPRSGGNLVNLEGPGNLIRRIDGDVCDVDACRSAVADQTIVFHCAALTSHRTRRRSPWIMCVPIALAHWCWRK